MPVSVGHRSGREGGGDFGVTQFLKPLGCEFQAIGPAQGAAVDQESPDIGFSSQGAEQGPCRSAQ